MLTAIEEHGGGKQLMRVRIWPRVSAPVALVWAMFAVLAAGAAYDGAVAVATGLGAVALFGLGTALRDCGAAMAALSKAVDAEQGHDVLRTRPAARSHVEREVTIAAAAAGDRVSSVASVESVDRLPDGNVPARSIGEDGASRSVRP